jgi:L-ribulose-5-phosphate 3-epimerase
MGVCSWSLRPKDAASLASSVERLGLSACQLALAPCVIDPGTWADAPQRLADRGVAVVSGMLAMAGEDYSTLESIRRTGGVALDERWPENLDLARRVAEYAAKAGIPLVTFHAGFLPHDRRDPLREKLLGRLRTVAAVFADWGVGLGLETGQERADTLLDALRDVGAGNVGLNFDPANMILYGMGDPVAALSLVAAHVVQIHIKDAKAARMAGEWGTEVVAGTGDVPWAPFLSNVRDRAAHVDLVIEREAGEARERDISQAVSLLARAAPWAAIGSGAGR